MNPFSQLELFKALAILMRHFPGSAPSGPVPVMENTEVIERPASTTRKPRRLFTSEEDRRLIQLVEQFGPNSWTIIADRIPGRTSRQCKERYFTYLCPDVKKAPWTEEEDELLFQKVREYGRRWSDIAKYFDGRTANSIKNRWHLHLRGHHRKSMPVRMMAPMPAPMPLYVDPTQYQWGMNVVPKRVVEPVKLPSITEMAGGLLLRNSHMEPQLAGGQQSGRQIFPSLMNLPFP